MTAHFLAPPEPAVAEPADDPSTAARPAFPPWLHGLVPVLHAPVQVWSEPSGQVVPEGAQGIYLGDRRLLSRAELTVDGRRPTPVADHPGEASEHVFLSVPRGLGMAGADATVRLERRRRVRADAVQERLIVRSYGAEPVRLTVSLCLECDLATMDAVRRGLQLPPVVPVVADGRADWERDGRRGAAVMADGAQVDLQGSAVVATWRVEIPSAGEVELGWQAELFDQDLIVRAPARAATWASPRVVSDDRRLAPVLDQALRDLRSLRLAPAESPAESFVAAGAPWFFTLFGRDSLWTARMLLPVSTELAASTLRVLASRQGRAVDLRSGEEPGKVLHEVRAAPVHIDAAPQDVVGHVERSLPPVYYGTIDATPLWVLTLHDAWRWGLDATAVEPLLGNLQAALTWMTDYGDADGDGLLEYEDASGTALVNQGWKDSGDAVRRADGTLAGPPIALSEVQGYAYAAALAGAELLETFGVGGTDRWREWAGRLRKRFRECFWVSDARGSFPAIALDGEKQPVVSATSNMGHLLGTGLLDPQEVDAVAQRLASPDMLSGFGIRTLSRDSRGYSPSGYHVGSVWPHDTAICLAGLAAERRPEAAPVAAALLRALDAFDGRPPELFCGDDVAEHPTPVPYPAACFPQAWAAASAVSLVQSVLGLRADVPSGAVTAATSGSWAFGPTTVGGLSAGDRALSVEVDRTGTACVHWDS